jgi:uncharacterized RDD family membrane protein YckC
MRCCPSDWLPWQVACRSWCRSWLAASPAWFRLAGDVACLREPVSTHFILSLGPTSTQDGDSRRPSFLKGPAGVSETSRSVDAPASLRAGLGQRALAIAIDLLVINLLIAVVGLAATGLTDARVRVANTVLNVVDCASRVPVSPGVTLPDGFEAAGARLCTRSVFGIVHDWTLVVSETAKAGEDARDRRQIAIPADRAGRPVQAFYLDDVILVVLGAYLIILQWRFGTTLGKRIVGIRVQSLSGAPLTIFQAATRNSPTLIMLLAAVATEGSSSPILPETYLINVKLVTSHGIADSGLWWDGLKLIAFLYFISLVVAEARRRQPLHDQWAATEVVYSTTASSL